MPGMPDAQSSSLSAGFSSTENGVMMRL